MKENFLNVLKCPKCGKSNLSLDIEEKNDLEIRKGNVLCCDCNLSFGIESGVLNFMYDPSNVVIMERNAHVQNDVLPTGTGIPFQDSLKKYRHEYLSLPDGNDSEIFKKDNYFRNVKKTAGIYYESLKLIETKEPIVILDCGADTCWSCAHLSKKGYQCVALDINHHIYASDIFIEENQSHFERILSDMNNLPFKDGVFDIVMTVAAVHHTSDLENTLKGFGRVLKSGGKVLLIGESCCSVFDSSIKENFGGYEKEIGINEQIFSLTQYEEAAKKAGFDFRFIIMPGNSYKTDTTSSNWKGRIYADFLRGIDYMPVFGEKLAKMMLLAKPAHTTMLLSKI